MTSKQKGPGILCAECGARIDRNEYYSHRCDCERIAAEKRAAQQQARTRSIVAHNMRMMEQAATEWEYA